MHDAGAGLALQEHFGQQTHQVVALDEGALCVEEKAPVIVPVPGEAHIRAVVQHRLPRGARFSSSMGLGTPCGKVPSGS